MVFSFSNKHQKSQCDIIFSGRDVFANGM